MLKKSLLLSVLLLAGCSSQSVTVSNNTVKNLLDYHNKERTSRKIASLTLDSNLCEYAQEHAEKMAKSNNLYHSKMKDLILASGKTNVAENIAWGQIDEKSVVNSWMWSPGHRWNILNESYSRVGFGSAKDKDNHIYWCTVFSD